MRSLVSYKSSYKGAICQMGICSSSNSRGTLWLLPTRTQLFELPLKRSFPFEVLRAREALHKSSGKWALRIRMDCKAQTTTIAVAIARICNAADRLRPQMHTARRFVQSFPR